MKERERPRTGEEIDDAGLAIAAGTHPFSTWQEQGFTPEERYMSLQEDLQAVAHRNLIFGLHVHVGVEDDDFRVEAEHAARNPEEGTSAERQRAVHRETGSLEAVVDHVREETKRGVR